MIKRLISILVVLSVLLSCAAAFAASETDTEMAYRMKPLQDKLSAMQKVDITESLEKFKDMKMHWSRTEVGKLTCLEIVSGNGNGMFAPNRKLQVDQFLKMVIRGLGFTPGESISNWAKEYIDLALQYGLISKGEFTRYSSPITREQMAKIIYLAAMLVDTAPDNKYDQYIIGKLKDYTKISNNLKHYVLGCFKLGLVTGDKNQFCPKNTLTRAEAATVILRLLDKAARKPMKPAANEVLIIEHGDGVGIEFFPTTVPEIFNVATTMKNAIPKAKGYVLFICNPETKVIKAYFYKDKATMEKSIYDMVGSYTIYYGQGPNFQYCLNVYDDESYKEFFKEYTYEILKALYESDAQKAITLHDKYINMITDSRKYEEVTINNRVTDVIRPDSSAFTMQTKIKGMK